MTFRIVILGLLTCCYSVVCHGQERFYADYYYVAPPAESAKSAASARRFALPEQTVQEYLAQPMPSFVLEEFADGQKALG